MTIEEKAEAIKDYCTNKIDTCDKCPIDKLYTGHHRCYVLPEADVELHYKVLFGETENDVANDAVNHPNHYTQGGIECIDAMQAAFGANELAVYCKIAAFKYIWRCEHKNGLEDVKKAVWYLSKYIELMERDGE